MSGDGEKFSIAEMMFHHTADAHELDFGGYIIHLPQWEPVHIGSFAIDLSPTRHVVFLVLAAIITVTLMWITANGVEKARKAGVPPKGFAGMMEMIVLYVRNDIAIANIGEEEGRRWAPFIMTLFFLILVSNFLGLIPFGSSPTGNLAMTGALAFIVLLAIEIGGMFKLGFKGYMGTIFPHVEGLSGVGAVAMSVGMAPIEVLSKLVKPFALAVRLFGNMTAGHFVLLSLFGIVFMFSGLGVVSSGGIALVTAAVVVGIMFLEMIVALLQAYVFALLSAVFIGMMQHEH
jgi:F-type H+-transporting ATPase subunit a